MGNDVAACLESFLATCPFAKLIDEKDQGNFRVFVNSKQLILKDLMSNQRRLVSNPRCHV